MGKRLFCVLIFSLLICSCSADISQLIEATQSTTNADFLTEGTYFGEEPPGVEPVKFGVGFLNGHYHSSPVFSPDGRNVWWAGEYGSATIYYSEVIDGDWLEPEIVEFSEKINSYRDPFISPDGLRLYFISPSALPGETSSGKENIWMMEKDGDEWKVPQPLPDVINRYSLHWTISVANNYNLYFAANDRGKSDIYISEYRNGEYQEPYMLDEIISSDVIEFTPNIAPDESYLLFSRLEDRNSNPYLFITYATESGWSEPQKVENIPYCISPIITPDRKYVIFMGSPTSIYWRDTSFVEELRVE
jgi:Tol biopolymer transport system component